MSEDEHIHKFMFSLREPTWTYFNRLAEKRGLTIQELIRDILGKIVEEAGTRKDARDRRP